MPVNGGDPQHERDELFLRWVEADLCSNPLRMGRLNRYEAALQGSTAAGSPPSWTALAATAGVLGVDAATLAVAVQASSSSLMLLAVMLFCAVPVPLWWRNKNVHRNDHP